MARHRSIDTSNLPFAFAGRAPAPRSRPAASDDVPRILAVCEPGDLEDRLGAAVRTLGQSVRFLRAFSAALERLREQFHEIVVVARTKNGMDARDFVREVKKVNDDSVVVLAAPASEYGQLTSVMLEGVYDFLPADADADQLRLMLGRAMDHSRLRRRTNRLERALDVQTASLQQRLRELALLNEMTRDIVSVPELDEVLRRALDRILDVFGSECGSFLILDAETDELVVRAAAGPGAGELVGRRRKLGEGVSGKVARSRHPVLVTDVANDSRFRSDVLAGRSVRHYRSGSFLAMPLIYHGRLLGEMNVTERGSGLAFTQDDLRLFATLGGHVASAINGALAAEELRKTNEALQREMAAARRQLRAADGKLGEVEWLARAVVRHAPAAMAAFDPGFTVTFANEAAERVLDLGPGRSLRRLAGCPALAPLVDAAADALAGRVRHLALGAGAEAPLAVVVAPVRGPGGAVTGGTVIAAPARCPLLNGLVKEETPQ